MREPAFTVKTATELAPDCFFTEVNVSTEGAVWHRFTGKTEREANTKAQVFIAETRGRFLKSLASVEARRAGRMAQSLRAASGPTEA